MRWYPALVPVALAACAPAEQPRSTTLPTALVVAPSSASAIAAASTSASTDAMPEAGSAVAPAAKALGTRIEEARVAYYSASDGAEAAVLTKLSDEIAADLTVDDSEIRRERDARDRNVTSLHAGPTRVYPAPRTMHWMLGVVKALDEALKKRHP